MGRANLIIKGFIMTKTLEEIEAQVVSDADLKGLLLPRGAENRKTLHAWRKINAQRGDHFAKQSERLDAACRHAEKRIQELKQAIADNRSANHMNEQYPHDFAVSIMQHLSEIALDLRARVGTPGSGKLK
jgi:hypothetical protein